VPSVRSRLVCANVASNLRGSKSTPPRAVSWCTITSGSAAATAAATASGSSASSTAAWAPHSSSSAAFAGVRVVPVTKCPAVTSRGTSCRPRAPVAPATRTFISGLLKFALRP
jgi:hypothetical protein